MKAKLVFIYDGHCPFCNKFAELIEFKGSFGDIEVKDAREYPEVLPKGYDMDVRGAILLRDDEALYGPEAINWICTQIKEPSDLLLKLLSFTFLSSHRSSFLFPFLLFSRRVALLLKGIPRKIPSIS